MAARDESEELEELEDDSRWSDWEGSDEDEGNDSQRAGIWFLPLCVPSTSKTNETCYVKTAKDALEYDTKQRGFDIAKVVKELKLGFYDCIKLVNYVRHEASLGKFDGGGDVFGRELESALIDGSLRSWADEQYLIPVLENDRFLLELDETLDIDMDSQNFSSAAGDAQTDPSALGGQLEMLAEENEELRSTVAKLKESLKIAGSFLEQDTPAVPADRQTTKEVKNRKIDKNYFDSYAGFGIHREMLSDRPRMKAYRSAIELNASSLIKDKEVLDVGCGTGILSMISARSGARHVCAVDGSTTIAATAQEVIEENKLSDSIDVKNGLIEVEGTLPEGYQCDVIVSEWMGYCLLYESMLFSVLHARDKYLRKGGCLLPDVAQIFVAGCNDAAISLSFWDDVEGFTMKCVGKKLLEREMQSKAHVMNVNGSSIITTSSLVSQFDLCTMTADEAKFFSSEFELQLSAVPEGTQKLHSLVLWFDTLFSQKHCEKEVTLTTSPKDESTHWAQTLLVLPQPLLMNSASESEKSVKCRLTFKQHSDDYRGLQLVLEYGYNKSSKDGSYPLAAQYELV